MVIHDGKPPTANTSVVGTLYGVPLIMCMRMYKCVLCMWVHLCLCLCVHVRMYAYISVRLAALSKRNNYPMDLDVAFLEQEILKSSEVCAAPSFRK